MFKKKIRMILLLTLVLIGSIAGITNVNAQTDKIQAGSYVQGPYYYMHAKGSHLLWEQTSMIIRQSDGAFVYCVQPFVKISSSATYDVTTEDMNAVANISKENWKRIEKLAYYGYGYNENGIDHTDIRWYPATQMLIWKYADPTVDSYFTKTLKGNRDDSILASEMAELERLVDEHTILPAFNDVPSEMVIGNTITINDSKNVLSKYNIENVKGGTVTKNGNSLNITATEVGNITFDITRNGNRYGEPTKLYYAVDSQNVVRRGNIDPTRTNLEIKVVGGKVTPNKYDDETLTNTPQGEATLEGAVYGIYKDDGTKVGTVTTGKDGKATSDYLPSLGRFYLLEEMASTGYQLDKNKYYFEITTNNLFPEVQVFEKVISLDFDFTKVYANDKTGIMTPEVGVVFGIYNNKGEEVRRLTTDSQGNIKFRLPYGTYTVKQLTSTFGHEKADDFTIEVKQTGTVVKKVIANAEVRAKLKVVKVDSETGNVIKRSGIKFKILNTDTNEYVCQNITYPTSQKVCVFETDKNGEFITPYELSSGHYVLEEEDQVIDGYLWNKVSQPFTIGEDMEVITDSEYGIIFTTKFENTPVKGRVEINKTAEEVVIKNGKFEYTSKKIEGVLFGLYANEDIIYNGKVVLTKGTKVSEAKTDKDGHISFENLYLGKYYIQEISTLDKYILDSNKYEFELTYKDQYTPVIIETKSLLNILKKGTLEFTKTDVTTGKAIADTRIEVYTENDELIFTGTTDKEGKVIIENLFIGKFYIIETEASTGYRLSDEKVFFEVEDNGEIVKAEMTNEKITSTVKIHKIDQDGNTLAGVEIGIFDLDGNLIDSYITDENGLIEIELEYGKYYYQELSTINGYILNDEKVYFDVTEDGAIIEKTLVNTKEEVKVPNTEANDLKVLLITGTLLMLGGTAIIIYGKKKNKK